MRPFLVASALLCLTACASYDGRGLIPGSSTEADVEAVMGEPAEVRHVANGETILWYPRLPYGGQSFAARIGPDGTLLGIEQRLTDENIAKVVPNKSNADDVLDIIGPPYKKYPLPRMQREAWEYQLVGYLRPRVLYVQLSPDQVVRESFVIDDPAAVRDGGGFRGMLRR
jgi:hypothetical protein